MLSATSEAALKQAESASKAAQELMSSNDKMEQKSEDTSKLHEKLSKLEGELEKAKKGKSHFRVCTSFLRHISRYLFPLISERSIAVKDLEAIKLQSEGTNREYDRLVEEHNKLTKKLAILEGGNSKSDKKAD